MKVYKIYLICFIILITSSIIISQQIPNKKTLLKPNIRATNNFDGNRIDCDIENTGMFVSHNISGRSGLEWPKGNNTHTVFASGVWLGGKVYGEVRVSAGEYAGEYASGPWGANHNDPKHKIYRVSKRDLADPISIADIQNWPIDLGAPWVDENNNGTYEPLPYGPDHPHFIGDQVLWMVMNDGPDSLHSVFHTASLGVEVQRTIFGFDRPDALGDMMFIKDLIINKGNDPIDEMYVGLWSDPDLGDAADDFVGCDTTLGMGICYNSRPDHDFINYFGGTPAVGYDYFQGPIVPAMGETAYAFGRDIPDYKNLKMSSFSKYIGTDDPTWSDPNSAQEAYNLLRGMMKSGLPFDDAFTGGSNFVHPGDPTKDTGPNDNELVEADIHRSGDKRFLMSSGPFNMAPGDSQEVVFAVFMAADGDPLDSYLKLKEVDIIAQYFYDNRFRTSPPPPKPQVNVTSLEDQIILTWDNLAETYQADDIIDIDPITGDITHYEFEGYNVYQLESANEIGKKKRIATFDKINGITKIYDDIFDTKYGVYVNVVTQYGSDSGINHEFQITVDALRNNVPLLVNREYYFAVTAYGYNPHGIPKTLESSKEIIAIRPQVPSTWSANSDTVQYNYYFESEQTKGTGDGSVSVTVIDPTQITGNDYKVTFNDELLVGTETLPITNWNLINTTTGQTILQKQTIFNDVDILTGDTLGYDANPIVEGLRLQVYSPKPDLKYVAVVANANGAFDPPVDALPYWRYPDWLVGAGEYENAQISGGVWMLNTHPSYGPGGPETFYNSVVVYSGGDGSPKQGMPALVPFDFECRFTGHGQAYDYWNGTGIHDVPFEWWNIGMGTPEDPTDDYKLISYFLDDDGDGEWGLTPFDHETSGGENDPYTDRIYVMSPTNATPGTQGHDDFFANVLPDGSNVALWTSVPGDNDPGGPMDTWNVLSNLVFMNWNGGDVNAVPQVFNALEPETGTIFRIVTTKPNSSRDEFSFSTVTLAGSTHKYSPKAIKAWPNPYFGYNPEEQSAADRQIHFTNLPTSGKCLLRIFDLTGTLVKKIAHTNGTQFEIWDVRDYNTNPVTSGMYLVHVETEYKDKILKIAVVQPQY